MKANKFLKYLVALAKFSPQEGAGNRSQFLDPKILVKNVRETKNATKFFILKIFKFKNFNISRRFQQKS